MPVEKTKWSKKFKIIWVAQPSHDFSLLKEYGEEIKFITTGYEESVAGILPQIEKAMEEYNPQTDAIVAVGKVNTCLLIGMALGKLNKIPTLGVYERQEEKGGYKWIKHPTLQ